MIPALRWSAYNAGVNELSPDEQQVLLVLLTRTRWAALGTARDNEPLASWVATVADIEPGCFLMHLSHLALHTRYLLVNPRASLAYSQFDADPERDPQTLARVSLQGTMAILPSAGIDYHASRARYLSALPEAEVQFGLGDFYLMRFETESARFVPGFGRAHRLHREALSTFLTRG